MSSSYHFFKLSRSLVASSVDDQYLISPTLCTLLLPMNVNVWLFMYVEKVKIKLSCSCGLFKVFRDVLYSIVSSVLVKLYIYMYHIDEAANPLWDIAMHIDQEL